MLDVSFLGAALAGLLSFLSPCILPIVPFYLSYLAGVGMNQVSSGEPLDAAVRRRAIFSSIAFALGVITIFVGLGASASAFGQLVRDYFGVLRWIAAIIIGIMGLHFIGILRIGLLYRQIRADVGDTKNLSIVGSFVIGMAFAFGWTPCVGPVLAAILFTAAGTDSAIRGAALLFVYGAGMTIPFVIAATFIGPFMRWMARFRKHLPLVEKIMGVLLLIFAILIATDSMNIIAGWMLNYFPALG